MRSTPDVVGDGTINPGSYARKSTNGLITLGENTAHVTTRLKLPEFDSRDGHSKARANVLLFEEHRHLAKLTQYRSKT